MATRGIIARKRSESTFEGRYHHYDSYFEKLGETLCTLYTGHFQRDIRAMLTVLIDEHPTGWCSMNDCDFTLPVGFCDDRRRPQCYCHGEHQGPEVLYTSLPDPNQTDIEFVYCIDECAVMTVYHRSRYLHRDGYAWVMIKTVHMAEITTTRNDQYE